MNSLSLVKKPWTEADRLISREKEITEICNDINSIKEIYRDLSVIIQSQSEPIQLLNDLCEESKINVEQGLENLEKAKKYQSGALKWTFISGLAGAAIAGPMGAAMGLKWMAFITAGGGGIIGSFIPNLF